jgi:hypothetical protein
LPLAPALLPLAPPAPAPATPLPALPVVLPAAPAVAPPSGGFAQHLLPLELHASAPHSRKAAHAITEIRRASRMSKKR